MHPLVDLPVACFHGGCLLRPVIDHCAKVLVLPNNADFFFLDHKWVCASHVPSEVDGDLFSLCYVKFQEVIRADCQNLVSSFLFPIKILGSLVLDTPFYQLIHCTPV